MSKCRIAYYSNATATRRILLLSGDVEVNPGWENGLKTFDPTHISYSERSGSSTPPLKSFIPVRISERRYFTHLNRHQHQSHNTLHYIHIDNTVYSASFVPATDSSRWEARANTPKPIPVRIRPPRYTGHALKQKPTRNKRNHNLIVVPRTPMASGFKPGKSIELCLLNSRSIKNKASLLNDFVIENKVDVMTITETWLLPGDVDQAVKTDVTPQGYVLRCVSREKRGGGVAVLCKKPLLAKVNPAKRFKSFEYMDTLLKSCSKLLRLVVVYRPPPSNKNKSTNELFFRH